MVLKSQSILNLLGVINNLRKKHLKDTFLFIVRQDHVLEDALKCMQKPTFGVNHEMMVRNIICM